MLSNQLLAEKACLEYKLNEIRKFCRMHLEMSPELIELNGVLTILESPVKVPANFKLEEPFVEESRLKEFIKKEVVK